MNKKDVYQKGYWTGYDIAKENAYSELNPDCFTQDELEQFSSDMAEHESDTFRQYSPFEFFAKDLNNSHDPEGLWEAYDNGVWAGIQRLIRQFKRVHRKGYIKPVITVQVSLA